jgi:DNA-binding LytR/AlgR family response regulator
MKPMKILILEDEPLVALDLEALVCETAPSDVRWMSSVSGARDVADDGIDLALLDVEVKDGVTYDFARALQDGGTPFVFISGSKPEDVPAELRHVTFIAKPYRARDIARVIAQRAAHLANDR